MFGSVFVTLTPFQPEKLKTIRWDADWEMILEGGSVLVRDTKIFVEYGR
jgi:hypothetical protein